MAGLALARKGRIAPGGLRRLSQDPIRVRGLMVGCVFEGGASAWQKIRNSSLVLILRHIRNGCK